MRKIDVILGALIGFLNGAFFFFILKEIFKEFPFAWTLPIIFAFLGAFGLFIASIIGKKILIIYQAAKFLLVGTLNTFIDIGILNILIGLTKIAKGRFYVLFKTISFVGATINSYIWNKYWTFEKKTEIPQTKEFLKFLIVTAVGLLINVGVASLVVNIIGPQLGLNERVWATVGAIIAAFSAFVWNFFGSKFIVFKK